MELTFLENKREVSSEWHITQAQLWLEYDNGRMLDNVLIYASLEVRCAIERFMFELLLLMKSGRLTPEEEERCRSKDGILSVIKENETNYRKLLQFTNIIAELNELPPIAQVDLGLLIRAWHRISNYCHKQIKSQETFESPDNNWQREGFTFLSEMLAQMLTWQTKNAFGIVDKNSMPEEVREIYEKFANDEIDTDQARRMLKIATPVLTLRALLRIS